jgi:hypothetical protein
LDFPCTKSILSLLGIVNRTKKPNMHIAHAINTVFKMRHDTRNGYFQKKKKNIIFIAYKKKIQKECNKNVYYSSTILYLFLFLFCTFLIFFCSTHKTSSVTMSHHSFYSMPYSMWKHLFKVMYFTFTDINRLLNINNWSTLPYTESTFSPIQHFSRR